MSQPDGADYLGQNAVQLIRNIVRFSKCGATPARGVATPTAVSGGEAVSGRYVNSSLQDHLLRHTDVGIELANDRRCSASPCEVP